MWLVWIAVLICIFFSFVRFTIVKEGTAKVITRFGGVVKVFIQWTGHNLTLNGDVVFTGAKRPWYGGLRAWIGTPFDRVYKYKLRWHSIEEVEGKRKPVFHEKIKDCVELRPDRYWRRSIQVETKDGMFPDIEWLIGLRCINPEKTLYRSPHNWVENALTQLEPLLRRYVYTKTLEEILDLTREQIWQDIGQDRAITEVLKNEWGIQIDEKEIGIFDIKLPPTYQEALARKKQMELEMKAKVEREKIERRAERYELRHVMKRAAEIRDTVRLSPEDAIEVVQTERGKVIKRIIEYKGLEKIGGLPLIIISGGETSKTKRPLTKKKSSKRARLLNPEEFMEYLKRI